MIGCLADMEISLIELAHTAAFIVKKATRMQIQRTACFVVATLKDRYVYGYEAYLFVDFCDFSGDNCKLCSYIKVCVVNYFDCVNR